MIKLFILVIAVLALGTGLIPALSWVLAFFILLMLADLIRSELRKHLGRYRQA
jgi:hypothetical protein